jgi:hypothetical protein
MVKTRSECVFHTMHVQVGHEIKRKTCMLTIKCYGSLHNACAQDAHYLLPILCVLYLRVP